MPDLPEELKPGEPFGYRDAAGVPRVGSRSAAWLGGAAAAARRASPGVPGLDATGLDPADGRRPIMARLTGSSSPYSWAEVYPDPAGSGFLAHPAGRAGTSNAYEANAVSGLGSRVVRLRPGAGGDWRFQHVRMGTIETVPAPCCEGNIPTTLYYKWSYQTVGRSRVGGGVLCPSIITTINVTTTLTYTASYAFPFTGITGRAWIGCEQRIEQAKDFGTVCTSSPTFMAYTDDAAVRSYFGVGGRCAVLVSYEPLQSDCVGTPAADSRYCEVPWPCSSQPAASTGVAWRMGGTGCLLVSCGPYVVNLNISPLGSRQVKDTP